MIIDQWKNEIPAHFPDSSRVWVYQSDRIFHSEEEQKLTVYLNQYVEEWISHGRPVKGWAKVLFHQFIIIMADDGADRLCGSAIDGSIRFIKEIETKMGVDLLDRMKLGFATENGVRVIPMHEVEGQIKNGELKKETLFFNNTVSTKGALLQDWIQPLDKSFLGRRMAIV